MAIRKSFMHFKVECHAEHCALEVISVDSSTASEK
jgi:hypothetical protein